MNSMGYTDEYIRRNRQAFSLDFNQDERALTKEIKKDDKNYEKQLERNRTDSHDEIYYG